MPGHEVVQPSKRFRRRGFTLIELLVVVAMIAVLLSLIFPAIQNSRESARRMQCMNNLKQIGAALHSYHTTHSVFPYASTCSFPAESRFTHVKQTWTELILPFLDQSAIYQKIDLSASVDVGANRKLFEQKIFPFYACPSNPYSETFRTRDGSYFSEWRTNDNPDGAGAVQGLAYPLCAGSIFPDFVPPDCMAGTNSYCVSEDPRSGLPSWWAPQNSISPGMFNRGITSTSLASATDGTSNTFLAGERNAEECCLGAVFSWNAPVFFTGQQLNSPTRSAVSTEYIKNCGSSSHHLSGGNFLFVDGSVHFLASSIDFRLYCSLGDVADAFGEKEDASY